MARGSKSSPRRSVRFSEQLDFAPQAIFEPYDTERRVEHLTEAEPLPQTTFGTAGGAQGWSFPTNKKPIDEAEPVNPLDSSKPSRDLILHDTSRSRHSGRRSSSVTFVENNKDKEDLSRVSFSSYNHPYEIQPPPGAYSGQGNNLYSSEVNNMRHGSLASQSTTSSSFASAKDNYDPEAAIPTFKYRKRQGFLSNLIDLYNLYDNEADNQRASKVRDIIVNVRDKEGSLYSQQKWHEGELIEPDDPLVTGFRKKHLDDEEDRRAYARKAMTYKQRRREQQMMRIEFNITSVLNRQAFLMRLAKGLLTFGAPSHRIESQLLAAARILEVDAEFTHMPGVIMASFGDEETKSSQMHFVKCGSRLSLGNLHRLHQVYRAVLHDELSARKGIEAVDNLLKSGPTYNIWIRMLLSFLIASLICPLAFGGSLIDMWFAGIGSVCLTAVQHFVVSKRSVIYANVFELLTVIFISFCARALSSIRSQIFCYTSISSAGIVTILPGYLILTSSLDLASKNVFCGSVKMVYALIYTLFLAFALQFGSDLYLIFDQTARKELDTLAYRTAMATSVTGTYIASNASSLRDIPAIGQFSFTTATPFIRQNIFKGCYRPPTFPWYEMPLPWWSQFIIVPLFSILSSLNNDQPIGWDLVVMVFISVVSYTCNKIADHFIFNRSDVVSAIGAFVIGFMGNTYSRVKGGTAFTSMVTGVLFLVPSGLSEAGGITAQNNATQIGGAMIQVTIGITVGLFMSQGIVYMFGSRKNAAVFSF